MPLSSPDHAELLEHARSSPWRGRLVNVTHQGRQVNAACGDDVSLALSVTEGVVCELRFEGRGCFISQAAASLLCENAAGQSLEALSNRSMDDLLGFDVKELLPSRQYCASLGYRAMMQALGLTLAYANTDRRPVEHAPMAYRRRSADSDAQGTEVDSIVSEQQPTDLTSWQVCTSIAKPADAEATFNAANLRDVFDAAYCINLARRPDRWDRFRKQIPVDWPFVEIQRFEAVDGRCVPPPAWWRPGAGAWGCYRSHAALIERALNAGCKSLLLFEDDAVFCEDFTRRITQFLNALPSDWGMVYLGGQHLSVDRHPPQKINEFVYRPYNVNRTHAYALRGQTMVRVYQHLLRHDWQRNHHIDHHLGLLHQSRQHPVYCPATWLVGQAEGQSNINGRAMPQRFWLGSRKIVEIDPENEPFVAVLGLHGSGSSCIAGVLHHLGVYLGEKLGGFYGNDPNNNRCGFEAEGLRRICEAAFPFPQTKPRLSGSEVAKRLQKWLNEKRREAADRNTVAGGKYPQLCRMGRELLDLCGDQLRIVVSERSLTESIQSIQRRCPRQDPDKLAEHQQWLEEGRQWICSQVPPERQLIVPYAEMLDNPTPQAWRIAEFLNVTPTEAQLQAIATWVDPRKRHVQV